MPVKIGRLSGAEGRLFVSAGHARVEIIRHPAPCLFPEGAKPRGSDERQSRMSRSIPTINTHRLTLRGMRAEDFNRFAEIWAMPEVVRYIDKEPWPRSKAWAAFLRHAGHWQIAGFGQWAIHQHRAMDMSGQAGFFYAKRDLGSDFDDFPEAGWVLVPEAQGQGFADEAVSAAHDWFDRVVTGRLVCMIHPENTGSIELAEMLGYSKLRAASYQDEPVILFERLGPPQ